jgi:hypothetical protein
MSPRVAALLWANLAALALVAVPPAWASSFQWGPASTTQNGYMSAGTQSIGGQKTFPDGLIVGTSLRIGSAGSTFSAVIRYDPTLTPTSVSAATSAEQTFTVNGLLSTSRVYINSPASLGNGLGVASCRASADNTLAVVFVNATAGPLTPVSGVYPVLEFQP